MNAAIITALVTSVVALLSAVFAIFKWRDERASWEKAFQSERRKGVADWQIQFLHDVVERRLATYSGVFMTLAAVRDVPGEDDHLVTIHDYPERLIETAHELLRHLYGEAGLVMSMSTRNEMHSARMACLRFQSGAESIDGLIDSFFYARRQLRRDIQLADSESFKTAVSEIGEERLAMPKTASAAPDPALDPPGAGRRRAWLGGGSGPGKE